MIKNYGKNKLCRTSSHRKATLRNMATSLFLHERVQTSLTRAKALRSFAERLITCAKRGQHLRVRRDISDRVAVKKLFDVLAQRYQDRPGGYTQVLRLGRRTGDGALQGLIRLVQ
ncbi:MAG: 50S ribosomal protein L17 [Elusimicrobiota bacterium]